MGKIKDYSLYLVISEEYGNGRSALEVAKSAIAGGVNIIQMREKNKPRSELIGLGKKLSGLCKENGVTFIVNDDPVIAKEVGADGVHLGQEDIKKYTVEAARQILGNDKIIGISTHSLETFEKVNVEGIDYIAFGPVFPTAIKNNHIGTKDVKRILAAAQVSVFFIGGINMSNIDSLLKEGARNIALIRGILEAESIESAAMNFKDKLKKAKA